MRMTAQPIEPVIVSVASTAVGGDGKRSLTAVQAHELSTTAVTALAGVTRGPPYHSSG